MPHALGACLNSYRKHRRSPGGATTSAPVTCGTPTHSSPGCWPAAGTTRAGSSHPPAAASRAGKPAWFWRPGNTSGRGALPRQAGMRGHHEPDLLREPGTRLLAVSGGHQTVERVRRCLGQEQGRLHQLQLQDARTALVVPDEINTGVERNTEPVRHDIDRL